MGLQNTARDWRRSQNAEILDSIIASGVPSTSFDQESTRPGVSAFVATAHHKDDQIETMILKLLRGVHLTNFQEVDALPKTVESSLYCCSVDERCYWP